MVKSFDVNEFAKEIDLKIIYQGDGRKVRLEEREICRPGLQFSGFFNFFEYKRVQVIGLVEYMYMNEKPKEYRMKIFKKYFSYDMPCVIVTRDLTPHPELVHCAIESGIPVFEAMEVTTEMKLKLMNFLCNVLAPQIDRHGVLLDIFGIGVMLMGESGIGKSETALELIKRQNRLIADDVIHIKKTSPKKLVGSAPEATRYLLEIRGIGIIDVSKMYGIASVIDEKPINLVLELEMWEKNKHYERIGLEHQSIAVLGVDLPYMLLPVRPGRNLAIVIEAAARYHILNMRGHNPAKELEKRMFELL